MTDTGIYVFDHDGVKNMQGQDVTINYRVLETKDCAEVLAGRVYVVLNPYNFTEVDYQGQRRLVMHESNFVAELEGYDAACFEVEPVLSDAPDLYPVCAR
jgi:co-chaperonin GroES (HSP10)